MAENRDCIRIRGSIRGALTRFVTFVSEFQAGDSVTELKRRLNNAELLLDKFERVQLECEIADERAREINPELEEIDHNLEIIEFENAYHSIVAQAVDLIANALGNVSRVELKEENEKTQEHKVSNFKLPAIKIPEFDGKYERWLNFRDTYQSLIHNNAAVSDIQKFHYLQSCLKGKAAEVIGSLEITNNNYNIAWELLVDRYDNKRIIVYAHVKAIVEMQSLSKESSGGLRDLLDETLRNIRALKALGEEVDGWGTLLIYIIVSKFDTVTRKEWEKESNNNKLPTMREVEEFLRSRCQLLETIASNIKTPVATDNFNRKPRFKFSTNVAIQKADCKYCKGEHLIYFCKSFLQLSKEERNKGVRELRLCINCLKKGHGVKDCASWRRCEECKLKHNTLLHYETSKNAIVEQDNKGGPEKQIVAHSMVNREDDCVLLSTAIVNFLDSKGRAVRARVILDNGSTINYISQELFSKLKLPYLKISPVKISGINNCNSVASTKLNATIGSLNTSYEMELTFLVMKRITADLPLVSFNNTWLDLDEGIKLADPRFNVSSPIEALLGAQVFYDLLLWGKIRLGQQLALQNSKLGWIATGSVRLEENNNKYKDQTCCLAVGSDEGRDTLLERFWKLEEMPHSKFLTVDEHECESNFARSTSRDEQGRFIVTLPRQLKVPVLGNSYMTALNRFYSLEKRLDRDTNLKGEYVKFMQEYERLGHMEKIREVKNDSSTRDFESCSSKEKMVYYIPHHPVIKVESSTTRLRVVFDASAETSNGVSLNNILLNGPKVQSDIFSILLRFRRHRIIISADVEKMFRQIWVDQSSQDLQRILWRENTREALGIYRLKTVTYGLKPASYLATRCITEIATQNKDLYPQASQAILQNTYVDDFISGVNDEQEAVLLKHQVDTILDKAGFKLRKWRSNSKGFLEKCKLVNCEDKHLIKDSKELKTLGIVWQAENDVLKFIVNIKGHTNQRVTKRSILSVVSQIFDPLGLVAPVIVFAKMFLQQLWLAELTWDQEVPDNLRVIWEQLQVQLLRLNNLEIQRQAFGKGNSKVEIHGFSDASERAYGCAIYVRSLDDDGRIKCHLMCSKSRVAPLKQISLPKLELSGALLLAKLIKLVISELGVSFDRIVCWTDSTIVLNWLSKHPSSWKTFVANRVAKIQDLTQGYSWRHVVSAENPADIVTRGLGAEHLVNSMWWHGPPWLVKDASEWPKAYNQNIDVIDMPEYKTLKVTLINLVESFGIIERYSSLFKLKRVMALCLKFINKMRIKNRIYAKGVGNALTVEEIDRAMVVLVKLAQKGEFAPEIARLEGNKELNKNSKILALNPFMGNDGILRVGGRIRKGDYVFEKRHPILLPKNHHLTRLIIRDEHLKNMHAGSQHILGSIREKYWPISGLNTVKGVIRECVTCSRFNPIRMTTLMGNLPKERVEPSRPFLNTGLDFAGPLLIRERAFRNKRFIKIYVCIFVCFSTKAVHVELVSDLTAESFVNCLKRFVARRGIPSTFYSDNATNFVAADKRLRAIQTEIEMNLDSAFLKNYLLKCSIKWRFMPPRTPHFGGLHESAVKSLKKHLYCCMPESKFTFEQMHTVCCGIESILNSRPLTPSSADPDDLRALTPGHFLVGSRLDMVPTSSVFGIRQGWISHFEEMQSVVERFWARWKLEYLTTLQARKKWKVDGGKQLKLGQLVLLHDETPPQLWKMGRIKGLSMGNDGHVRVVTVKTAGGEVTRGLVKVSPLLIEDGSSIGGEFV